MKSFVVLLTVSKVTQILIVCGVILGEGPGKGLLYQSEISLLPTFLGNNEAQKQH